MINLSRPLLAPVGYLVGCCVLTALLAYPVAELIDGVISYRSLMSRGTLIALFLCLIPLGQSIGIGREAMGLAGWNRVLRQIGRGLLGGTLIMTLQVLMLLGLGVRVLNEANVAALQDYPYRISKYLLTGIGVGLNEEILFRGFLLAYLFGKLNRWGAVLVCSVYFALLHFLSPRMDPTVDQLSWTTGFDFIVDAFGNVPCKFNIDTFLALFSAGAFLGAVRILIPASLGYCIGLHAGWVFVIKFGRHLTRLAPDSHWPFLVGHFDGVIGYLSFAWISLLTWLLIVYWQRKEASQNL